MRKRRLSRTLTAVIVVTILPLHISAGEDHPADVAAQQKGKVAALIHQLADDSRTVRSKARRELLELGPSILPLLPPPEELPGASVREAVRDIRLNLEKGLARDSVKPSHVKVSDDLTLDAFLKAVMAQTGNEIDISVLPAEILQRRLKLDGERQTFWEAMDQATNQTGLVYAANSGARSLKLEVSRERPDIPPTSVAYDGVFRTAVDKGQLRPIFGDAAHRLLRVEVVLLTEPRLRPLFLQYALRELSATGPNGQQIESFSPGASYELPLENGRSGVSARGEFRVPAALELEQIDLHGSMTMQTAAGSETFRFRDLKQSAGKARRQGGVVTTLRKVEFQPAASGEFSAEIAIAVAYETGGPAFESHRTWIFHNETWLEGKDGKRLEPEADYKTLLQANGAVAVEYRFERLTGNSGEYSFVYVAPTMIINVPVKFEIRQIPVSSSTPEGTTP